MNIAQKIYVAIGGTAFLNSAPWENEKKEKKQKSWGSSTAKMQYKLRKRYTHILSDVITERNLSSIQKKEGNEALRTAS